MSPKEIYWFRQSHNFCNNNRVEINHFKITCGKCIRRNTYFSEIIELLTFDYPSKFTVNTS